MICKYNIRIIAAVLIAVIFTAMTGGHRAVYAEKHKRCSETVNNFKKERHRIIINTVKKLILMLQIKVMLPNTTAMI